MTELDDNIHLLYSEHVGDRRRGSAWLLAHTDESHDVLVQIVRERPEINATYAAIGLLGRMNRPDDVPVLSDTMTRERGSVLWEAAKALAVHSAPEAERALVDALSNANDEVVSAAVVALGTRKAKPARIAIEKLLDHSVPGVRYRATLALGALGSKASMAALKKRRTVEHDPDVISVLDRFITQ